MENEKPAIVELYKDDSEEWRWKAVAPNGRIVADSGEGYKNKGDALNEIGKLFPESSVEVKGE